MEVITAHCKISTSGTLVLFASSIITVMMLTNHN